MKSSEKFSQHNPFTPTFGCVPQEMVGRQSLVDNVLEGLANAVGDPNRASIFIGPRGSGKTVLLTTLVQEANEHGWLGILVTSGEGLLQEILVQTTEKGSHLLSKEHISHITELQLAGFGIAREVSAQRSTWRSEITALVAELNEKGSGLLIAIDEVSPSNTELHVVVDVFQNLVSEGRDVAIALAGLPSKVSGLLSVDHISFLRRAFQHRLDPIPDSEVVQALKDTIEENGRTISQDALFTAAKATQGFAFLVQLVGYHVWRQNPQAINITLDDVNIGLELTRSDMDRMIFGATINDLTEREIEYLLAMAQAGQQVKTAAVANQLGISASHASNIRKSLIEQGLIGSPRQGVVAFELPMLREYLLENCEVISLH